MRVCLPIWEFHDQGGIERSVTELVRWLLEHGHVVEVLTYRNRSTLTHPQLTVREIPLPKIPLSNRPVRSLIEVPLFVLAASAFIWKHRARWDTVVNYGVGQTCAQDVLVATSCHIAWIRERRRVLGKGLGSPLNAFIIGIERYNYRRSRNKTVVAVSHQVAAQIEHFYGIDASRIHVVYPGVDVQSFTPGDRPAERWNLSERYGVPPADRWIIFCGYEYQRKGLDVLVRAVVQVDDPRIRVVVVGDDPMLRPRILALAEQLGVAPRVHFVGSQPSVVPWFKAADIFVLPTRMDAFGMVVLEAMACGIPVVTTSAAGVAELISSWENGYVLTDPENVSELAAVVRRLASDEGLRRRLGDAGRRVAMRHTWDEHARGIMDAIQARQVAKCD